ncbi:MAG: hypothetical protein ISR77_28950 [Pirellulaceae bacterium]|nr:hypothetical protein [Pirellulaceae bacterium]
MRQWMWMWILCGLTPCWLWGAEPSPEDGPPEAIFHCDFDSEVWPQQWGLSAAPQRTQLVDADPDRKFQPLKGQALRVHVEQGGHYGLSLTFPFKKRLGYEPEDVYFRYYLRFADDWTPRRGGKLPGFGGTYGRAGWGGRPVDGTDGWSARGLFEGRKDGRTPIGFYCYHMDMKGRYGSNWVWDRDERGFLQNNRWYCIEQYVKLNTPDQPDGILRGWVDGGLAFEKTDVRFRSIDRLKIEAVWINVYLGGTWTAEQDHHLYLDEVVISKQPIGPLDLEK